MLIDCDTCIVRGAACGHCVVTVLLGAPPSASGGVELDGAEQAAIAVLAESGLVPPLRLLPSADQDEHWVRSDREPRTEPGSRAVS